MDIEKYNCKYCGKECKNKNSLIQHEIRCKENPNRLVSPFVKYNKLNKENGTIWNKGLTKETDDRVKKQSQTLKQRYINGDFIAPFKGKKHTMESREKTSKSLKKFLKENPNMVPYLRNHSSKISYPEQYFLELFKKENINLKYHLQIGLYQLDFYDEEYKKYIEIDGSQHYLPKSIIKDKQRDEYLKSLGWKGMRINWSEYQKMNNEEKENVVNQIRLFIMCP